MTRGQRGHYAAVAALTLLSSAMAQAPEPEAPLFPSSAAAPAPVPPQALAGIRGAHLTSWAAGSPKARREFIRRLRWAGLNAVVIALKEYDGLVFVPEPLARQIGAYTPAIPDLSECVRDFKEQGIYTIGRIVLFKDNLLARQRPEWAVLRPDGSLWVNDKGVAWVDPYRREVWEYNLAIASRAAAHFDEIQFDYIRFPSDGDTSLCRYSRPDHSRRTAARNLLEFLALARERLAPLRVKLSVCLFGMTTTDGRGMGIGQNMTELARQADFLSPMMYPSHYAKGEYKIPDPNREPYKTIRLGLIDATARLGPEAYKLRPYLQDFSLGVRYGPAQVRAQIMAAARLGVWSWLLWNPNNKYTWSAVPRAEDLPPVESPREETP